MAVPNSITQTNLEFGGLAVVVDSSVALAGNWLTILRYLGMFVQRLSQINYGLGYRIAWVTYGPPDSSPSSLLCKRFFAEIVDVTNLIKVPDELYQLGIGTTHCGGTRGMAMLEGLVAAVELFDTLNSLSEVPRRSPSHILHVTASFPDNTKHPQANMSPSLDEITWESLPGELSKRNILLSSIVLNPKNNTKIPEIHSSVTLNTAPISWLTVDAPHVAYVVSLSLSQKGVKRPGDQINNAEQPPEKRHQSNVPSLSPPRNKPNTNVNVNPSSAPIPNSSKPPSLGLSGPPQPKPSGASDQPPAGQPSQLMPPNLANLPPLNSTQKIPWPGIGNLTPTELLQRWRQLEEMRRRTDAVLGQAMNNGETAKAETVKQQIAQWEPMLQRFRTMANSYLNALKRAGMAGAQILNAMTSSLGQPQASSSTSSTGGSTGNIHPNLNNPDPSSQPQTTQSNPNSSSSSNTNISLPATKPNDGTSAATDSSSTLVPSAASTSTKPSPKSVPRPSPKLPTVKPSPKSKLKASPIKHAASNASNASSTSSTIASSSNASLVTSTNSTAVPGTTSGVPISSNSNLPPEAALQMQKLMEQGGRGHPRDMAMGSMGQASPSLTAAGVTPQSQLQAQGMQGILPGQGQSGQQSQVGGVVGTGAGAIIGGPPGFSAPNVPTPATSAGVQGQNDGIPAWTGIFSYSGEGGVTTRKISVMAMSANHLECRAHTWPSEMILTHTRDPVVTLREFQMWAKKMRPVVCTLKSHARNPDARQNAMNEQIFNGIQAIVQGSKNYIVSSWTLPSGAQTNNVLFALVPPHGFIGAFFPVNGIPEMPKSIPGLATMPGGMLGGLSMGGGGGGMGPGTGVGGSTGPGPNIGSANVMALLRSFGVTAELTNRILQMPPEGQMQAIKSIVATKQAQLRQAQAQAQGGAGAGGAGQAGIPGMPKSGGVNITAAAAAMALRMQQSGGMGMSPGIQGGLQGTPGLNMAGMQRQVSGQDGNKPNQQQVANMAALFSGMRGNMGGMGGMNAGNLGNMSGGSAAGNMGGMGGGAGMSLQQQMAQMQQMQQNRAAFGGGSTGSGAGGAGGKNLSMDMLQSFMHRNGQEGQGGGQPG